ncbi:MAG: hypothetical protein Q9182_004516 [Xanthomendoza sp. 2 TL-2023]
MTPMWWITLRFLFALNNLVPVFAYVSEMLYRALMLILPFIFNGLHYIAGLLIAMLLTISWTLEEFLQKVVASWKCSRSVAKKYDSQKWIILTMLFNNNVALGANGLNGLAISRLGMSRVLEMIFQDVVWADQDMVKPNPDLEEDTASSENVGHQHLERTGAVSSTEDCDQSGLCCEDFDFFEQQICRNGQRPAVSIAKVQMDDGPTISASIPVGTSTAPAPQPAKDMPGSSSIGSKIEQTVNPPYPSPWSLESRGIQGNSNHPCLASPPIASLQVDTAKNQRSKSPSDFGLGSFRPELRGGITLAAALALPTIKAEAPVSNPIRRGPDSGILVLQPIPPTATLTRPFELHKKGQQWARLLAYGAVYIQDSAIEASGTNEPSVSGLLHATGAIGAVVASNGIGFRKGDRSRRSRPTTPQTRPMPKARKDEPESPPSPTPAQENSVSSPAVPYAQGLALVQKLSAMTIKDEPMSDVISKKSSKVTKKITAKSNVEPRPSEPSTKPIPRATVTEGTISNAATTNVPITDKKSKIKLLVWPPSSAPEWAKVFNTAASDGGSSIPLAQPTAGDDQLPGPGATKPTTSAKKPSSKSTRSCEPAPKQTSPLKEVQTAPCTEPSLGTNDKTLDLTQAATDVDVLEQAQAKPARSVAETLPTTPSSALATKPVLKPDAPQEEVSVSVSDLACQAASVEDALLKAAVETPLPVNPYKLKLDVKPRASTSSTAQVPLFAPPQQNLKTAGPTTPDATLALISTVFGNYSSPLGVKYEYDLPPALREIGLRLFRRHAERECKSRQEVPDMMEIDYQQDSDDDLVPNEPVNEPVKVDYNGDVEMADAELANVEGDSGYGSDMEIDTDLNSDADPMDINEDTPARVLRELEQPVKYRRLKIGSLEWHCRRQERYEDAYFRHMA